MTTNDAGDILNVTPNSAGRFYREGPLRGAVKTVEGQTMLILNGRDVQWLHGLRARHGVAAGMMKARQAATTRFGKTKAQRGGR